VEEQIWALGKSKLVLDGRVAGDEDGVAEEAGEKAVNKMLLEGTSKMTEKDAEPVYETGDQATEASPKLSSPLVQRKKSTIVGMATKETSKRKSQQLE
jgi:SWI/SNF-related matrix-associated actin-dependent regulator 1 of chromatin subfamily A